MLTYIVCAFFHSHLTHFHSLLTTPTNNSCYFICALYLNCMCILPIVCANFQRMGHWVFYRFLLLLSSQDPTEFSPHLILCKAIPMFVLLLLLDISFDFWPQCTYVYCIIVGQRVHNKICCTQLHATQTLLMPSFGTFFTSAPGSQEPLENFKNYTVIALLAPETSVRTWTAPTQRNQNP